MPDPQPTYASVDDVRETLNASGASVDAGSASGMEGEAIDRAIVAAESTINARLGGRYAVPFTDPVPPVVRDVTARLAAYRATLTYRQGKPLEERHPVWLMGQDAIKLLDQLADGTSIIPPATPGGAGTEEGPAVAVVNRYDGTLFAAGDFDLGHDLGYGRGSRCRPWSR